MKNLDKMVRGFIINKSSKVGKTRLNALNIASRKRRKRRKRWQGRPRKVKEDPKEQISESRIAGKLLFL